MIWVAARRVGDSVETFGYVHAPDAITAVQCARHHWPACGVMPWRAFKQLRRAQLSLGLPLTKEPFDGRVQ